MNYIITTRNKYFEKIGQYDYCSLEEMILPNKIAVDTETTALKPHKGELFAVQIGTGENNYLIDIASIGIENVIPYLENRVLVFHNAKFDLGWFYKHNFFPWKVRDTMLSSQILNNGLKEIKHSFGHVMERELGLIYDKSEQQNIAKTQLSTSKAISYCFQDVDRLLELDEALNKKIISGGYLPTYQLHRRWIRASAYMEQCGVPINIDKWKQKINNDKIQQKEKEFLVKSYIYSNLPQYREQQLDLFSTEKKDIKIDISSPKQMLKVFKDFNINVISKDVDEKTGKFKESISEDIISKSKHEFVKIWLEYQSITHDVTTFGENILPSVHNGRLYTNYKPILDTARISAGGKNRGDVNDVNTLNIPANEKSRSPFESKEGYKMIVSDYSNQEGYTGADITGDEAMIDSIINNKDLHCMFVRVLYPHLSDLSDNEIKEKHNDERQKAKICRFALQFGGTGYTIHLNENIPLEEAMNIEKGYKTLHSGVTDYGNKKLEEAIELGYIESTMGFKLHLRYFDHFKEKHIWLKSLDKAWWRKYKEGKTQYKEKKQCEENKKEYIIKNHSSFDLYRKNVMDISKYFKSKSEYMRLCLNNPAQTTAAHQTKRATNRIYEYIWKKKDFWKARIALAVHDELDLEVIEDLADEYKEITEKFMVEEGNKLLKNPLLKMKVGINICNNWYEGK